MFYDRFLSLCEARGVRPGRACTEMGLSRSLAAKWKSTGVERPSTEVLEKMAGYFGLTIDEILEPRPAGAVRPATDEEVKFALFGGGDEITDEMYEEVKSFAAYVKEKYKKR